MKQFSKKITALALLLGLILSSISPMVVLGASDGKITVGNALNGKKYDLYRVFDLTYNADVGAYTYTAVTEALETAIKGTTEAPGIYKALDSGRKNQAGRMIIDETPLTDGTINPYDFSIWLAKQDNGMFKKEGDQLTATSDNAANIFWENLPLGYYMVRSDAGTVVSLNTTDKDKTIYEKNILPSLTKQVKGGSAADFADLTYANIGEELEFKITFDVHNHANTKYVLKDVVPAGIDISASSLEVKLGEAVLGADKYTVNEMFKTQTTATRNLEITFPLTTIQEIAASLRGDKGTVDETGLATKKTITITYKGKLNNSALMSNHEAFSEANSNRNKAELIYDKHSVQNPLKATDYADVRTTDFNIFKFAVKKGDGSNTSGTDQPLANAKFKIYTQETEGTALQFSKPQNNKEEYFMVDGGTEETEITTTDTGKFSIKGLKLGTYYIEETQAPDGFNPLQKRVKLVIAENDEKNALKYTANIDGTDIVLTEGEPAVNSNVLKIENKTGARLPETGGMGRKLIYGLGGLLFFGSLVLLVARKKTREDRA